MSEFSLTVEHNGKSFEVDYDGYLYHGFEYYSDEDLEDWYDYVRIKNGIPAITSENREVLKYYQNYYKKNGLAPIPRTRRKELNISDQSIQKLFPSKDSHLTIIMMAGLTRPITCWQ